VPKADPIALADALAKEIRMGSKEIFKAYRFDALNRYDVNRTHLEIENLYARLT
jgi:hypothetical protein